MSPTPAAVKSEFQPCVSWTRTRPEVQEVCPFRFAEKEPHVRGSVQLLQQATRENQSPHQFPVGMAIAFFFTRIFNDNRKSRTPRNRPSGASRRGRFSSL